MKKNKTKAVWIFDESYKVPTYLSVASWIANCVNTTVELIYTGIDLEDDLKERFLELSDSVSISWEPQFNTVSRRDKHLKNRLKRMEIMKRWPEQLVFLLDGDLLFDRGVERLVSQLEQKIEVYDSEELIAGVPEYDLPFYTEKRDDFGGSKKETEELTHKTLKMVFGDNYATRLSRVQYNNGMLGCIGASSLADLWKAHYLMGLENQEVNPEDDQLPLAVALFDLDFETIELEKKYNSLGYLDGKYCVFHAWNGKWKKELLRVMNGCVENDYAILLESYWKQIPLHWQKQLYLHEEASV